MRITSLLLLVVAAATAAGSEELTRYFNLDDAPKLFENFIKDNDRHYKDEADRQVHYNAFVENLKYINDYNAKNSGVTLGITLFADMTEEERKHRFSGVIPRSQVADAVSLNRYKFDTRKLKIIDDTYL